VVNLFNSEGLPASPFTSEDEIPRRWDASSAALSDSLLGGAKILSDSPSGRV
jgi:hypothetical protein